MGVFTTSLRTLRRCVGIKEKYRNSLKLRYLLILLVFSELLFRVPYAEREGFEPPEQLPVHRISSAARSTTPASLLGVELIKMK